MSIVFFGTPSFALPTLKLLVETGEDVRLVVTQPDKPQGRKRDVIPPPTKVYALSKGIDIIQPHSLKDEKVCDVLRKYNPEFFVVVAYGKILPKDVLSIPSIAPVNIHGSLLPKYRGAAPIQWAIINGEQKTGVTTMLMDEGLDTGDILLQAETDISNDDDFITLSERLSTIGADLLMQTLKGLRNKTIKPMKQDDTLATYAPPLKVEDARILWQKTSTEIFNLIRGINVWPVAYCFYKGERLKVFSAEPVSEDGLPGRIEDIRDGRLIVGTGRGSIAIKEIQPDGKRRMSCKDFLSGRRFLIKHDYLD
ncbi:MAG: methionyl-tRNA formyltransferase [Thermodesulfovibrionales bacterium]|nr:methionyl-tRNA formyltransferase [Thermodesulfovibrionales bacterium]